MNQCTYIVVAIKNIFHYRLEREATMLTYLFGENLHASWISAIPFGYHTIDGLTLLSFE